MFRGIQARTGEPTGAVLLEGYLNTLQVLRAGLLPQTPCTHLSDRDAEMWQEGEDFHVKEAGWDSTSKLVKAQTEIGTTANPFCH